MRITKSKLLKQTTQASNWLKKAGKRILSLINANEQPFIDSTTYWEQRYKNGGNSGYGSYGLLAVFKAELLNQLVKEHNIRTVIEHGCGDGNQLLLANYPTYLGLDVSAKAIDICRNRFRNDLSKTFLTTTSYQGEKAELALSLDVIYHLVEDNIFNDYMCKLANSGTRFIVIYSSNMHQDMTTSFSHVRHRRFTDWMAANASQWILYKHVPNKYPYMGDARYGSSADFFIYQIAPQS